MAKKANGLSTNRVSMVTEGTILEGTLRTEGDVSVSGRVVGMVMTEARVVVASAGVIDGKVVATDADVTGGVQGDLDVAKRLVLRSGARVDGSLKAGKLVIEDGAVFNGVCQMVQGEVPPAPPRRHSALRPKRQGRSVQTGPESSSPPVPKTASKAPSGNRKGFRRAEIAVLGIFLVVILASGVYYGFEMISGATEEASGPPADLSVETGETLVEAETASEDTPEDVSLFSVSETPSDDPTDFAAPIEAVRQAAGLDRIMMEQTRQSILNRSAEPEVAALYQQAETTRRAGMRQFETGNFEQAADSFRAARDLFGQMQQRPDEKDRPLEKEDLPDAAMKDSADATPEVPSDPVEEDPVEVAPEDDPEATLEEVRTVVGRLARQLKLSIEREDVTGMRALFYRGWVPFFVEADAISAVVRYENVQPSGAEVTADVYLDLAYRDEENQLRQRARAYVWTLMRLGDEWVLRRVSSR